MTLSDLSDRGLATVGLSDLSDLSDPRLTVSDSARTWCRSELLSDAVGLLSDTVGPVGLSDCRTCRTVGLLSEVTVGLSDQGSKIQQPLVNAVKEWLVHPDVLTALPDAIDAALRAITSRLWNLETQRSCFDYLDYRDSGYVPARSARSTSIVVVMVMVLGSHAS